MIFRSRSSDSGTYTCEADNGYSSGKYFTTSFKIMQKIVRKSFYPTSLNNTTQYYIFRSRFNSNCCWECSNLWAMWGQSPFRKLQIDCQSSILYKQVLCKILLQVVYNGRSVKRWKRWKRIIFYFNYILNTIKQYISLRIWNYFSSSKLS